MQFSAQQIATILHGTIHGSPDKLVNQLAKIEEANSDSISFLSNPKYEHFLYECEAGIVVVNDSLKLDNTKTVKSTLIRVNNAYQAFSKLLKLYDTMKRDRKGIEKPSFIHETAVLGVDCYVGAFAYIGKNSVIGNNVKIYPHVFIGDEVILQDDSVLYSGVRVYHECQIGKRVVIHSGTVIGSDGFGFAPDGNGGYDKVPQIGNVIIQDDVEIGANTVLDRATLGSTLIKKGVKLDNLIQIAHNVEIGNATVIAAQTGVSGSTKIGDNVVLGGQVGVVGHISIADGNQVQAQSGVNRSLEEKNKKWAGSPAFPYSTELRSQVIYAKLPQLEKRIAELEKNLNEKY